MWTREAADPDAHAKSLKALDWLGDVDSNHDKQSQSLLSYR